MQYLCIKPPINPADQNKILIQDANKQQHKLQPLKYPLG